MYTASDTVMLCCRTPARLPCLNVANDIFQSDENRAKLQHLQQHVFFVGAADTAATLTKILLKLWHLYTC